MLVLRKGGGDGNGGGGDGDGGAAGARRLANSSFVARRKGGNAKRMRAAQRQGGRSALEGVDIADTR